MSRFRAALVMMGVTIIAVAGFAVPADAEVFGLPTRVFDLDAVSSSYESWGDGRIQRVTYLGAVCIRYETNGGTLLGYVCPNQGGDPTDLTQRRVSSSSTEYYGRWRMRLYRGENVDSADTFMYFYCHKDTDDAVVNAPMRISPRLSVDVRESAAKDETFSWAGSGVSNHCNVVGLKIYTKFIGNSTADYTFDYFYVHYERYGNP